MAELDQRLLEDISEWSHERPVPGIDGVLRLDVRDGARVDSWYLTIQRGAVTVSRSPV